MENAVVRRLVLIFAVITFAAAWLVCVPLWSSGQGIASPQLGLIASVMMFTPSLAVLVIWFLTRPRGDRSPRELAAQTGLGLGPQRRRTILVIIGLWVGIPVFVVITTLICAALGLYRLDLVNLSLLAQQHQQLTGQTPNPQMMMLVSIGAVALTPILNAIPSFGEEWGWRGWLYPTLRRFGVWPAILVSGLIWGVWHAPLTLLGYNYALLGPWSALMFVPFCIAFGAVLAWTREFTGSIWPAIAAHGGFNGSTGLVLLLGAAGQEVNFALVGPISVVGILLFAGIAALLFKITSGRTPVTEPAIPGSFVP
ncbi:CPBP family intramembrane glutamic endopeptidase [Microlunatus speluncae]|uniref:CPBP family intramembrane glutamic endopeptidase n=1 Tax=Microlunatus speluncae TaxID=2594267 RepID=UPI0012666FAB|nr:type II CAAX endopeptidase family protein [Microlunatus speluncae]